MTFLAQKINIPQTIIGIVLVLVFISVMIYFLYYKKDTFAGYLPPSDTLIKINVDNSKNALKVEPFSEDLVYSNTKEGSGKIGSAVSC